MRNIPQNSIHISLRADGTETADSTLQTADTQAPYDAFEDGIDDYTATSDTVTLVPQTARDARPVLNSSDFLSAVKIASAPVSAQNQTRARAIKALYASTPEPLVARVDFPRIRPDMGQHEARTLSALSPAEAKLLKKTRRQDDLALDLHLIKKLNGFLNATNKAKTPELQEEMQAAAQQVEASTSHVLVYMLPDMIADLEREGSVEFTPFTERTAANKAKYTIRELAKPITFELGKEGKNAELNMIDIKGFGQVFVMKSLHGPITQHMPQNCLVIGGYASNHQPGFQLTFYGPTKDPSTVNTVVNASLGNQDLTPQAIRNIAFIAHKIASSLLNHPAKTV